MVRLGRFKMLALAAATALSSAASALALPYSFVASYDGNDCAGVFGKPFAECTTPDGTDTPNGSPIIAKYNTDGTGWEVNTGVFPGLLSSMFTLTGTSGNSGTWSYNGTTGVMITSFVVKAGGGGNSGGGFSLFKMNTPSTSFSNIAWDTATLGDKNLSHISFYDTAAPTVIPLPAGIWMMMAVAGGLVALGRRKPLA